MEWLSTGEMIDRLKVGEIASNDGNYVYITKSQLGNLNYSNSRGERKPEMGSNGTVIMNEWFMNLKWRISPNYVSYAEAMKARNKGKDIAVHYGGKKIKVKYHYEDDGFVLEEGQYEIVIDNMCTRSKTLPLSFVLNGKWTIEGDSQ